MACRAPVFYQGGLAAIISEFAFEALEEIFSYRPNPPQDDQCRSRRTACQSTLDGSNHRPTVRLPLADAGHRCAALRSRFRSKLVPQGLASASLCLGGGRTEVDGGWWPSPDPYQVVSKEMAIVSWGLDGG